MERGSEGTAVRKKSKYCRSERGNDDHASCCKSTASQTDTLAVLMSTERLGRRSAGPSAQER